MNCPRCGKNTLKKIAQTQGKRLLQCLSCKEIITYKIENGCWVRDKKDKMGDTNE